jgi:hypothetical protein
MNRCPSNITQIILFAEFLLIRHRFNGDFPEINSIIPTDILSKQGKKR